MENKKDNPRIFIPPPVFYALFFLAAIFIQKKLPINNTFFHKGISKFIGIIFFGTALFFLFRSLRQFFLSRNTVVTILPANSLQTNGIYSITRNPMYIGLAFVYSGLSCLIGNWWNFILIPLLLLFVQEYIIRREEKYLERRFGQEYHVYKNKVGRWF